MMMANLAAAHSTAPASAVRSTEVASGASDAEKRGARAGDPN